MKSLVDKFSVPSEELSIYCKSTKIAKKALENMEKRNFVSLEDEKERRKIVAK